MKSLLTRFLLIFVLLIFGATAFASMDGQAKPDAKSDAALRKIVSDITSGTADLSRMRPALLMSIEKNAALDITDQITPILGDDVLYFGVIATFEDALRDAADKTADYIRYNLARTHLLRARRVRLTTDKAAILTAASQVAAPFRVNGMRDFAALDLAADIEGERGRADDAIALYKRIATLGDAATPYPSKTYAAFKTAQLQQKIGQNDSALQYFAEAIRLERAAGNAQYLTHLSYQGIADIYVRQGNDPAALKAVADSARVTQNGDKPYRFRLDVARRLLQRGYKKAIMDFAAKAVQIAPDDPDAKQLSREAILSR